VTEDPIKTFAFEQLSEKEVWFEDAEEPAFYMFLCAVVPDDVVKWKSGFCVGSPMLGFVQKRFTTHKEIREHFKEATGKEVKLK